jgi:hypothetical protein
MNPELMRLEYCVARKGYQPFSLDHMQQATELLDLMVDGCEAHRCLLNVYLRPESGEEEA